MSDKQERNGEKGENRTSNILLDHFILHKIIPDVEGRDFMAELPNNISPVNAIIQAKYFQSNNEVIIRKEYIWDEDGIKKEFFALLHTDSNGEEIRYFFSAQEIKDNWMLSKRKKQKKQIDYYVFKLNKRDFVKFEKFKGHSKSEINSRIEHGIRQTEEYQNQKNIRLIQEGFNNPTQHIFDNSNQGLFNKLIGENIVDKLFIALGEFDSFRRVTSWRLIAKISFQENNNTATYYSHFSLLTNNSEILNMFKAIEITTGIKIKDKLVFKNVNDLEFKLNYIVQKLNDNLIHNLVDNKDNKEYIIYLNNISKCNCSDCNFDQLLFSQSYYSITSEDFNECWGLMKQAYGYFKLGKHDLANEIYKTIAEKSKENKEDILFFFAKYNQRLLAFKTFESNYPDLKKVLQNLNISEEKKDILSSLENNTLLNDYAKAIDDLYLNIKDFKQRINVNDTRNQINKLYAKVFEFINFIDGNFLLLNSFKDAELLFEKVIESCIISYSMRTPFSEHLDSFNDALVELALHHCESANLLSYFQRNQVWNLPYKSNNEYFRNALYNFFSIENVEYLFKEIVFDQNESRNNDLRKKTVQIFKNLCTLLAYVDFEFEITDILDRIIYFIIKLDLDFFDLSYLAHLLLSKPDLFSSIKFESLLYVLFEKENHRNGYLITNVLLALKEKNHKLIDDLLVSKIVHNAISNPDYGSLKVLPKILNQHDIDFLKNEIYKELDNNYNHKLFYQSVISEILEDPSLYLNQYLAFFNTVSDDKKYNSVFRARSPYTGIGEPLRKNLNNLVKVLIVIDNDTLIYNPVVKNIIDLFPYYNFILKIDQFTEKDEFDPLWILENQSEIVLRTLGENIVVKKRLKNSLLKNKNEKLSEIYIKYFDH